MPTPPPPRRVSTPAVPAALPDATAASVPAVRRGEGPYELEARYFSKDVTTEERGEIIHALGSIATPAAGEVLRRIFQLEKRQELKLDAFEAAFDLPDATCREQKFAVLQYGVSAAMPSPLRMGAVLALGQFDDPRVTPALRALAKDRDPEVREQALELLRERAENPP